MASIARKQSLSRFSCELLDELSFCCQLAANPRLRLAELADELLYERQSQLPELKRERDCLRAIEAMGGGAQDPNTKAAGVKGPPHRVQ